LKITDRVVGTARTATSAGACLTFALYVYAASDVQVTAHETLAVDRLAYTTANGFVAERHGELLPAGTTTVRLDEGVYYFRAVADVRLTLSQDSEVSVVHTTNTRTDFPDPPAAPRLWSDQGVHWDTHTVAFNAAGFGGAATTPVLTVIRDAA